MRAHHAGERDQDQRSPWPPPNRRPAGRTRKRPESVADALGEVAVGVGRRPSGFGADSLTRRLDPSTSAATASAPVTVEGRVGGGARYGMGRPVRIGPTSSTVSIEVASNAGRAGRDDQGDERDHADRRVRVTRRGITSASNPAANDGRSIRPRCVTGSPEPLARANGRSSRASQVAQLTHDVGDPGGETDHTECGTKRV